MRHFAIIAVLAAAALGQAELKPFGPVPSVRQLAWQQGELTIFVHFGVNTFTNREWGDGKEDPKIFNPARLDARQWAKAARDAGARVMILTAKHHDGFCLWPTKTTEHCVRNSAWKGGKGDVVKEFVEACREFGLKPGLYLSPWDRNSPAYGDSPRYNELYRAQLTELLSNYGDIYEVWFDGACGEGPNGKKQVYDWPPVHALVRKLAPEAVMFSDAGPDVRWIGNEQGIAGETNWSTVDPSIWIAPGKAAEGKRESRKSLNSGDAPTAENPNAVWRPGESDVSIRPGWFYHADQDAKVRSVENLVDLYFKSVGRNSLLLLNVPPTPEGLFHETDVKNLAGMRQRLDAIFKTDVAAGAKATASSARANCPPALALDGKADTYWAAEDSATRDVSIEIELARPAAFGVLMLQEHTPLGQRVAKWRLEAKIDGNWKEITRGTTIGYKRLARFKAVSASTVRLVIEEALAAPTLGALGLYLDPADGK